VTLVLERLEHIFGAAADPGQAAPMRAYMRDRFEFLGITSVPRRELTLDVLRGTPRPSEPELLGTARACWALPEREYQYFACDLLRRGAQRLTPAAVPVLRTLITTKPWWDTVDALAAHTAGPLVAAHPAVTSTMDEWAAPGTDLWLVRTAILHQLTFKARTDDLRDSPSLSVIRRLVAMGAAVRAYDPTVTKAIDGIEVCTDPYIACKEASVLAVLTEWDEFRWVDFDRVRTAMRGNAVVDTRNLLDPGRLAEAGLSCAGVGRPDQDVPADLQWELVR